MTIQNIDDTRPMMRVTDLEQIVDTLAVVGLVVLAIVLASGHATSNLAMLIATGEAVSLCTSYRLHKLEMLDEDRRSQSWFQITSTTVLTLKAAGVPDDVLTAIGGLVDRPPALRPSFETTVSRATGLARGREWLPIILHYSETQTDDTARDLDTETVMA